jgi:hypothetical protein
MSGERISDQEGVYGGDHDCRLPTTSEKGTQRRKFLPLLQRVITLAEFSDSPSLPLMFVLKSLLNRCADGSCV